MALLQKKKSDMLKLERIQYRSLKYIDCDFISSYSVLRKKYDKCLLYTGRLRNIMCEVFKCLNGRNPEFLRHMFGKNEFTYDIRSNKLILPKFNTMKYGKHSFRYNGTYFANII